MIIKIKNVILLIIVGIGASACLTQKPHASSISYPDYNKRVEVKNPNFIKKENALGVSISIGTTATGGYLGYQSKLIRTHNESSEGIANAGNVIIGAAIGYSVSRFVTYAFGKNKVIKPKSKEAWFAKINNQYTNVKDYDDGKTLVLINKDVEAKYVVRNITDISDFHLSFPSSQHNNEVFLKGIEALPREELPKLISTLPSTHDNKAKEEYFNRSETVVEFKEALQRYPEARANCDECSIINNLMLNANQSDLFYLAEKFRNNSCIDKVYSQLISNANNFEDYSEIERKIPQLKENVESKALELITDIEKAESFLSFFPNSYHNISIKEYISNEKRKITERNELLDKAAIGHGYDLMNSISELGNNMGTNTSLKVELLSEPVFDEGKISARYKISWFGEYWDQADNPLSIIGKGIVALATSGASLALEKSKTVEFILEGTVTCNFKTDKSFFEKITYENDYVKKSKVWNKNRIPTIVGLGVVAGIGYNSAEWAAKNGYLGESYNVYVLSDFNRKNSAYSDNVSNDEKSQTMSNQKESYSNQSSYSNANKSDKREKNFIHITIVYSDGSPASDVPIRLYESNGDMGDDKVITDHNGYAKIYNYDPYFAYGIFAKGSRYELKMNNGDSYKITIK